MNYNTFFLTPFIGDFYYSKPILKKDGLHFNFPHDFNDLRVWVSFRLYYGNGLWFFESKNIFEYIPYLEFDTRWLVNNIEKTVQNEYERQKQIS